MGMRDRSNWVQAELQAGRSRNEIFVGLAKSKPTEAGKIAYCIASIPQNDRAKKYIKYNATLCILLVVYSILTAITGLPIKPGEPSIFLLLTTVTPLIFAYFVFKYNGGIYRLAGIWFVIDLLETLLLTGIPNGIAVSKLMVLFFIVVLSFLIGRKVFPNLRILGVKKDDSGNYLL